MIDDAFKTVYVTIHPAAEMENGESVSLMARRGGKNSALVGQRSFSKTSKEPHEDDEYPIDLSFDEIPWLDMSASVGSLGKSLGKPAALSGADVTSRRAVTKSASARQMNRKKSPNDQKNLDFFRLLNKVNSKNDWDADSVNAMLEETPLLARKKYLFSAFKEPVMALHFLCAFNAPLECVKKCFKQNPSALRDASPSIGTPLHYACHYDASSRIVRYLASRDLPALTIVNRGKRTPLHLAVAQGSRTELVVLLTEACPGAAALVDKDEMTPLDLAVSLPKPDLAVVEDLTEVYPDAVISALPKAIRNESLGVDILKDLMLGNPKALSTPDEAMNLPLHTLVEAKRSYKEVKLCLDKYPPAAHATNGEGMTAFDLAKSMNLDDNLVALLKPNDDYLFV